MIPICFTVESNVFSISTTGSTACFKSELTWFIKLVLVLSWFSISVMELVMLSLTEAMERMESLILETCCWFSLFMSQILLIFLTLPQVSLQYLRRS